MSVMQFSVILKKQMSAGGGGMAAFVSQAGSFFKWPTFDLGGWFSTAEPTPEPPDKKPMEDDLDGPLPFVGPSPRTPLHYDSMVLALSTYSRPSRSFRMGEVNAVCQQARPLPLVPLHLSRLCPDHPSHPETTCSSLD